MKNKKGFTLIELLAVIVILAIIMVIAIPQVLKVIKSSRDSAWKNSGAMVAHSIELGASTDAAKNNRLPSAFLTAACTAPGTTLGGENGVVQEKDIEFGTCSSNVFNISGKGQFAGYTGTITCDLLGTCNFLDTTTY